MSSVLTTILDLPSEEKNRLLAELARHLLDRNEGRFAVRDSAGEMLLYSVPTNARANAQQVLDEADPEMLAELHRTAQDSDQDDMDEEEVLRFISTPHVGPSA